MLFHHALGRTEGVLAFAEALRVAGHEVDAPDLFQGVTFAAIDDGVAHAEALGFDEIVRRGTAAAEHLPADVVYAGLSLGALPAQALAQRRPGGRGALLLYGCVPASAFDCPWPDGVPLQVHGMADDPWWEGDVAEALAGEAADAELFVYPGTAHLFADPATEDYDAAAALLLTERVLAFLARVA